MGYFVERFPTLSKRKIERGLIAITLGKPSYYEVLFYISLH